MKYLLLALLPTLATASEINPTPLPVFLKSGFSSVLEFSDTPTRVVLGDSQNFKVEKLERSLVIKTLAPYATTNMFVYFKEENPRLFILNASEDAEPTYFKKFESVRAKASPATLPTTRPNKSVRACRLVSADFDTKKDYLVVNIILSADSSEPLKPNWSLVRIKNGSNVLTPTKLWSERKDVQKDSKVRARFVFAKPNVPRNLKDVKLIVPLLDGKAFTVPLARGGK